MQELTPSEIETYLRYAQLGLPRHTSYPIAPTWNENLGLGCYYDTLKEEVASGQEFSLYVHVPFCRSLCFYCGCTKEIISDEARAAKDPVANWLGHLECELEALGPALAGGRFRDIHFGGGTPTFLTADQLRALHGILGKHLDISRLESWSVEVDPRTTSREHLETLKTMGVTRLSLGVQDFNPAVQKAVNRLQPMDLVAKLVETIRDLGFSGINFDLIYGLPFQTEESVRETVDQVIQLEPDRIAFYRLAMIPDMFRWQRSFMREDLPGGETTLNMKLGAIRSFERAGYSFIGLDHFARPEDGLAVAHKDGNLQRNFQGMTTGGNLSLVGIGPSAISQLGRVYKQNPKSVKEWSRALDRAPDDAERSCRGLVLSEEDLLRKDVIQRIYGYGRIDKKEIEKRFDLDFDTHFRAERPALDDLHQQGLITDPSAPTIELTPLLGRLLVRVVGAVFDAYLPKDAYKNGVGKVSKVG